MVSDSHIGSVSTVPSRPSNPEKYALDCLFLWTEGEGGLYGSSPAFAAKTEGAPSVVSGTCGKCVSGRSLATSVPHNCFSRPFITPFLLSSNFPQVYILLVPIPGWVVTVHINLMALFSQTLPLENVHVSVTKASSYLVRKSLVLNIDSSRCLLELQQPITLLDGTSNVTPWTTLGGQLTLY